jgi:hypothetical protein
MDAPVPSRSPSRASSASSQLPLIGILSALTPETCRRLHASDGHVGDASRGGLVFEDGRSLTLATLASSTPSRTELGMLAERLRARAERDFLFSASGVDPWIVVTLGGGARLVRYRAAFRGSAGMLVCRVGLSARTELGFPDHPATRCAPDVGDALAFSGSVWCEERAEADGASFLMTVLRRDR